MIIYYIFTLFLMSISSIVHAVDSNVLAKKFVAVRMIQRQNLNNNLLEASATGKVKEVMHLINQGALVDALDHYKMTPLIHAARQSHEAVIIILLKNGARLNAQDINGETALHHAARKKHIDTVTLLISYNPNMNIKNNIGQTAKDILEISSISLE